MYIFKNIVNWRLEMGQVEREIKILDIDVKKIMKKMEELGVQPKGKFVQDVYTFDFLPLQEEYLNRLEKLRKTGDYREILALLREVRTCFSKEDLISLEKIIGTKDIIKYIETTGDYELLDDPIIIELMKKTNENYSKWIRLRQTGDTTTLTIKKIANSNGEYDLDAVIETEFKVPNIEIGKNFLADMGYFPALHQKKMRIAYDYENTEIVIDKWPKIPPYIEVEGQTKTDICRVVKALGFKADDMKVMNTDDVYTLNGLDLYSFKELDFSSEEEEEVIEYLADSENDLIIDRRNDNDIEK